MSLTYSVTLINEEQGINTTIQVGEDELILDVAQDQGISLPYSCRAGACFDCLGKVLVGKVEQTDKALSFLRPDELAAGYVLLCSASPGSDCEILTHQAEVLFG
jgi:ferredoxin